MDRLVYCLLPARVSNKERHFLCRLVSQFVTDRYFLHYFLPVWVATYRLTRRESSPPAVFIRCSAALCDKSADSLLLIDKIISPRWSSPSAGLPENTWRTDRQTDGERNRSEEHTSELQSRPHISYAVFCLKKKKQQRNKKW